jgi:carboxyl-terminal processing protease
MKVKEFNGAVKRGVSSALKELKEEGVDSYMLDLRGNLGGVLEGSLEIAGLCRDRGIWGVSRDVGVLTN